MRGKVIPTTAAQAIERARRFDKQLTYVLGAGGSDPTAPSPETTRDKRTGSDCIGFVLWAWGLDRYQPKDFPIYSGWINCDSAIMDADHDRRFFEHIPRPEPGCLITGPSIDLDRDGSRDRIGHVGLVTEVPAEWSMKDPQYDLLTVIHCHGRGKRKTSWAVDEEPGKTWAASNNWTTFRGQTNPRWGVRLLRYRKQAQ